MGYGAKMSSQMELLHSVHGSQNPQDANRYGLTLARIHAKDQCYSGQEAHKIKDGVAV